MESAVHHEIQSPCYTLDLEGLGSNKQYLEIKLGEKRVVFEKRELIRILQEIQKNYTIGEFDEDEFNLFIKHSLVDQLNTQ